MPTTPATPPTTPAGAALRHPDDPLPLDEAFERCYPAGVVGPTSEQGKHLQSRNLDQPWRPAPWHHALLRERARWDTRPDRAA